MIYEVTHFEREDTKEIENGLVMAVSKIHKIVVPVSIQINPQTRKVEVLQGIPKVSCLSEREAIGVILYDLAHEPATELAQIEAPDFVYGESFE